MKRSSYHNLPLSLCSVLHGLGIETMEFLGWLWQYFPEMIHNGGGALGKYFFDQFLRTVGSK